MTKYFLSPIKVTTMNERKKEHFSSSWAIVTIFSFVSCSSQW